MRGEVKTVLADWGTSSLRLWCIDGDGHVLREKQANLGMKALKPEAFEPALEELLSELKVGHEVPALICGMAGAKQGWQEAGYLEIPTRLDTLANHAIKVTSAKRDVYILPGLSQVSRETPDVMRGEETLLAGALSSGFEHPYYCLPGTHSKWVFMQNNAVNAFKTFMTGEIFAVLCENSTLSPFISSNFDGIMHKTEFKAAVLEIAANPQDLTSLFFNIRSEAILFGNKENAGHSARLSGLLIGAELASIKPLLTGKTGLIASGSLGKGYAMAMEVLEIKSEYIESRDVALGGLKHCARKISAERNWSNHETD